jgi:hypothetical protein
VRSVDLRYAAKSALLIITLIFFLVTLVI